MEIITSADNRAVKQTAALQQKKYRDAEGLFVIEGEKFTREIPPGWPVRYFMLSDAYAAVNDASRYEARAKTYNVPERVFAKMSNAAAPQGVLAVCEKKEMPVSDILRTDSFVVMLSGVNDPGNAGTLIRTAYAGGAGGVVADSSCADVYNPKTLQASAGAVFHIPVACGADARETIKLFNISGFMTAAADIKAETYPYLLDFTKKCVIIIGNESHGLAPDAVSLCKSRVKIPMPGGAESLNAAVAGGVLIYEAARQRLPMFTGER